MSHRVQLKPAAARQLGRLRGIEYVAMRGTILSLAANPRPKGTVKLSGEHNLWRLRVRIDSQQWRVLYTVDDKRRLVLITRVVRRDEGTYRRSEHL